MACKISPGDTKKPNTGYKIPKKERTVINMVARRRGKGISKCLELGQGRESRG
jgi:hypothetical protein